MKTCGSFRIYFKTEEKRKPIYHRNLNVPKKQKQKQAILQLYPKENSMIQKVFQISSLKKFKKTIIIQKNFFKHLEQEI